MNKGEHFSYIIGYPDGAVCPEGKITRAEVAASFFRLLEGDWPMAYWAAGSDFSDMKAKDWNALGKEWSGQFKNLKVSLFAY